MIAWNWIVITRHYRGCPLFAVHRFGQSTSLFLDFTAFCCFQVSFQRFLLDVAIHLLPADKLVEIDFVSIEIRAIDTGKFDFTVDRYPATTAHAGAIDHQRIETDEGRHLPGSRQLGHGTHHGYRSDAKHAVDLYAIVHHFGERNGHQPVNAVTAVIGGHDELLRGLSHLVFHDEQVLRARADDGRHPISGLSQRLDDRIDLGNTDATGKTDTMPELLDVSRMAERPADIRQIVPCFLLSKKPGGFADFLDNHGNGATLRVGVGNGDGNPLAGFVNAKNHELARLPAPGNLRRLDHKALDRRSEVGFVQDFVHITHFPSLFMEPLVSKSSLTFWPQIAKTWWYLSEKRTMPEAVIEKSQLKPVILEVLNDLFNISDLEEAKRTPIGRLFSLEAKVESLAREIRNLEHSLRAEMHAMNEVSNARFDQLNSRLGLVEKLLYLVLAAVVGGLIKVIFFP